MWQNLTQRGNFRNAPSACGGDRKFQGFASLLGGDNYSQPLKYKNEVKPITGSYLIGLQDDLPKRWTRFAKVNEFNQWLNVQALIFSIFLPVTTARRSPTYCSRPIEALENVSAVVIVAG